MRAFRFVKVRDLSEGLSLLAEKGDETAILAGGTDLVIQLKDEEVAPAAVLDISSLGKLSFIRDDGPELALGPLATFRDIAASPLIRQHVPLLAQAASAVGSPQIRNRGTVGGNLMNASPAADLLPPLVALEARATLVSAAGARVLSVEELVAGPYRTVRKPDEILTEIRFGKPPTGSGMTFYKLGRRNALAISRVNLAVILTPGPGEVIGRARLSIGSVTPAPWRCREVESFLGGGPASQDSFEEAGRLAAETFVKLAGARASTNYKRPVVRGLTARILSRAWGEVRPV